MEQGTRERVHGGTFKTMVHILASRRGDAVKGKLLQQAPQGERGGCERSTLPLRAHMHAMRS